MTITKKIKLIISFILFTSCSVQQQKKDNLDCKKLNIEADTNYFGQDENINSSMSDFNTSKTKSLDIVRILNDSGYDTKEKFKRIYIEDEKVFVFENNNLRELANDNLIRINEVFKNLQSNTTMINCESYSSRKFIYRYFVRRNGELIMTFYSNNLVDNLDKDLISEDFKYLDLFENMGNVP